MGQVYLAEDKKLSRKVAIKFLIDQETADDTQKKRLLREAQATAALDHPNICTIHEIGEEAGRSFIVMQYIEGETLALKMKQQCLTLEESIDIATQVAEAVEEAHSHGIIHRDLKPQNIMVSGRGQVKVLDFGLAKMVSTDVAKTGSTVSLLTAPGVPIGTVPFMSPEQLRVEELDGRSDIFSLGVILFEMVTGKPLFERDTPLATVSAILTYDPPELSQFKAGLPPRLDHVVRKCLEKDPQKRYASAREFLTDLKRVTNGGDTPIVPLDKTGHAGTRTKLLWLASALMVFGLLLTLLLSPAKEWLRRTMSSDGPVLEGTTAQPNLASIHTIAALPFAIESNNDEAEFLSRGFTQSLVNSLSRLPGMRVSAYSAVTRYEKQNIDPEIVGRDLNADALVMGRFTLRGESLLIDVELIEARTKSHLWGHSYSRQRSDILELQREICQDVNDRLRAGLSNDERRRVAHQHTNNYQAYRLYLMGRNAWSRRTPEYVKKSIEFYNEAISLDPTYALAYAGLSDAYTTLGVTLPVLPPSDVMPQAKAAAERALSYDETLSDAHTSLAIVRLMYEWDWDGAEREFKRAIDLNPNSSSARNWYAYYLIAMGRFDEAESEGERAIQLDPLSLFFNANKARTYYYARQYDRVIEHCNKILETNPKFHNAHYLLGLAYAQKGEAGRAVEEFQTVRSLAGDNPLWDAMLGYAYAKDRKRAEAQKLLAGLKEQARGKYIPPVHMAIIYAGLEDREQTLTWLEKAVNERSGMVVYLRIEPVFEVFGADVRFGRLLQQIGLEPVQ